MILDPLLGCVLKILPRSSLEMANLQLEHHALYTQQISVGFSNRKKKDEEICRKFCDVAHKGAREEGKDAATVDRRDASCCCKCFVEEGMGFGGDLLSVEFTAEDRWFVGDPVTIDQRY